MAYTDKEEQNTALYISKLENRVGVLESEKKERATSLLTLSERLIEISKKTRGVANKVEEAKKIAYLEGLWKSVEIIGKTSFTSTDSKDSAIQIMSSIKTEIELINEKSV